MIRVLFVCLGNICRSPMAEGIFRQAIEKKNLSIEVDSAATSSWEDGNPVHLGTQAILKERGIEVATMISRQVNQNDFKSFDWIIGMDQQNVRDLKSCSPEIYHPKIHLFMEVVTGNEAMDVPDPWYTGDFRQTEELIDQGVSEWITRIED